MIHGQDFHFCAHHSVELQALCGPDGMLSAAMAVESRDLPTPRMSADPVLAPGPLR